MLVQEDVCVLLVLLVLLVVLVLVPERITTTGLRRITSRPSWVEALVAAAAAAGAFRQSNFSSICPLGDKSGEGMAYGNTGSALYSLSRNNEALEYHKKDLEIAQQTGDIAGQGNTYSGMGICMINLGRV